MSSIERRNSKRISYLCEVEWEGNGSRVNTRINDLSTTGAFIDSMTCFNVGSVLKMKFQVGDTFIETAAEVRYAMQNVGMGVKFVDLKPAHLEVLKALVEGRSQGLPAGSSGPLQPVLSGDFAIICLFDVIQMIENSRLTGTLFVTLHDKCGAVHFNDGQIARAESGVHSDVAALHKFVDATEGTFEFRKSDSPFERTIYATSNAGILLDLLRSKEEQVMFKN